jgi:hypothetical protein
LERYLADVSDQPDMSFDIQIGLALLAKTKQNNDGMWSTIQKARIDITKTMSSSVTGSFRQCRDLLFQLHVLSEIELMITTLEGNQPNISSLSSALDSRMKVIGTSVKEKQYLLALRRAIFSLCA